MLQKGWYSWGQGGGTGREGSGGGGVVGGLGLLKVVRCRRRAGIPTFTEILRVGVVVVSGDRWCPSCPWKWWEWCGDRVVSFGSQDCQAGEGGGGGLVGLGDGWYGTPGIPDGAGVGCSRGVLEGSPLRSLIPSPLQGLQKLQPPLPQPPKVSHMGPLPYSLPKNNQIFTALIFFTSCDAQNSVFFVTN